MAICSNVAKILEISQTEETKRMLILIDKYKNKIPVFTWIDHVRRKGNPKHISTFFEPTHKRISTMSQEDILKRRGTPLLDHIGNARVVIIERISENICYILDGSTDLAIEAMSNYKWIYR